MTKKHFEFAASLVKNMGQPPSSGRHFTEHERAVVADAFVELFSEFNEKFDKVKFYKACEFDGVK